MIEVRTLEQLNNAIRKLRANSARGLGTLELIRSLDIDPLTDLRGSSWRGTNFSGCDLRGADLSDCRLSFCDFTGADVAGAMFYRADLHKSTIHRALNVEQAYMGADERRYVAFCWEMEARRPTGSTQVFQLNQRIQAATTFSGAKAQFEAIIASGLKPDEYSAGLLIGGSQTPSEAWDAFEIVKTSGAPLNDVAFTILAAKMKSVADVRAVMEIMGPHGLTPGTRIFNTLLARTKLDEDVQAILIEMRAAEIGRDKVTYDILMRKKADFGSRKLLLEELVEAGLRPGTLEMNILLRRARSESEADDTIEIANELDIGRNAETYALLAHFKARAGAYRQLIDDMIEDDVHPDQAFYSLALDRCQSFGEASFLYGRMIADGIKPTAVAYDRLADLAEIPHAERDAGRLGWPEEAIAALIRRIGN